MYALDFEYAGQFLSDYGFIICDFNNPSGADVVSAGSKITFNTVQRNNGKIYSLVDTKYNECFQTSFSICKNPEENESLWITNDEYRDLIRWLNRKEYLPMRIVPEEEDADSATCYYDASFSISRIEINKRLCGLELVMETNRPFGYGLEEIATLSINDINKEYLLVDISDEIGSVSPDMVITCNSPGDLCIHNSLTGSSMIITNCSLGEIVTVYGNEQIIESSDSMHKLYDCFNFEFLKIGNTYSCRENMISASIPCSIEIRYRPIIKSAL